MTLIWPNVSWNVMDYSKHHTLSLTVDPFNTDFDKRWSWMSLGRTLLNAAEQHAKARGFGMYDVNSENLTWVLSRLCVEIYSMPTVWENVNVTTWIESIYRLFTNRNFSIKGDDGKVYGYARSIWALIDYKTRQPQNLEELYSDNFSIYLAADEACPINKQGRVKPLLDTDWVKDIDTEYSDIDLNGHVNSIKYIEHIMNLFSINDYKDGRNLRRIEIAYMAESYFSDKLSLYKRDVDENTYDVEVKVKRESTIKDRINSAVQPETLVRCKLYFE